MRINRQITCKNKLTSVSSIKKLYFDGKIKLKKILSDVFIKTKKESNKKMIHKGDEFQHEYLKTRDIPNCISNADDNAGVKIKSVIYYPEDLEKMKDMTTKERIEYKKILKKEGRYEYKEETSIVPETNSIQNGEPRELPNSVSAKDEKFSIGGGAKINFYKEDLEKMKQMTIDEKLIYTEYLIENGLYYL